MAFQDSLTIGAGTYERLAASDPVWILSTSTADQPTYFRLNSDIPRNGVTNKSASALIQVQQFKNSLVAGGPDALCQVHMVLKWDPASFTQAEVEANRTIITTFAGVSANIAKIMRGEL